MPYFSNYLFLSKKVFSQLDTWGKIIYVNYNGFVGGEGGRDWGVVGQMFCAFSVKRVFDGHAFFVSLPTPPL